MRSSRVLYLGKAVGVGLFITALLLGASAYQALGQSRPTVPIGEHDVGGTVTSTKGPEAGVWVIAETTDLPTRFIRIVVTDDQGRYLLPDLPQANYQVWVRGYGLVDSPKQGAAPGRNMDLTATVAPDPRAAAQYYPAGYWFSLLSVPASSEFPGTGPDGNGINPNITRQEEWLRAIKNASCNGCHQIGNKATREIPDAWQPYETSAEAWQKRIQTGQASTLMYANAAQVGVDRLTQMFGDWTDRIAAGEYPPEAPSRPQGIERNLVLTLWDWVDPTHYTHDEVSTDRRKPTVNGYGLIYGSLEESGDYIPVLDPVHNTISQIPLTMADPATPAVRGPDMPQPSPYWGWEPIWDSKANVHNAMFDEDGRLWLTTTVRPPEDQPDFCKDGSSHPSAQLFPLTRANRHLGLYDPKSGQQTPIDTCFSTHHLMFAEDANNMLWTSGGGEVVGWLDTKKFLETGDAEASQGWTALIVDTNGNGVRDEYTEPNEPMDATKDMRISAPFYGVSPAPDGSIWGSIWQWPFPGAVVRLNPGPNPPETALAEVYEIPWDDPAVPNVGYGLRGMDVDRDGVVWTALASGHLASFDRRKCQGPLNGPTATGKHCPEGWSFYAEPVPQLKGVEGEGSGGASYYTWVDQFGSLGLGPNVPINTGNLADGLLALKDGQWVVLRVPYPMGFYAKWLDGRIDDADAGWKGRGLWASTSTRAPFHMETGKGTLPKVVHFQLRPDPLAR